MGPNPIWPASLSKEELGKRDGHAQKEDDVNTHQKVAIGQECGIYKPRRPRIAHKHETRQETRQDSSLELSERMGHIDFRLLASGIMKQ